MNLSIPNKIIPPSSQKSDQNNIVSLAGRSYSHIEKINNPLAKKYIEVRDNQFEDFNNRVIGQLESDSVNLGNVLFKTKALSLTLGKNNVLQKLKSILRPSDPYKVIDRAWGQMLGDVKKLLAQEVHDPRWVAFEN